VADSERNVSVLDGDGQVQGRFRPGQPVRRLRSNRMGTIFAVLSGQGVLYAVDRQGQLEWRVELQGEIGDFALDVAGENVAAVSPEGWLHFYSELTHERLVVPVGVPMTSVAICGEDPVQAVVCTEQGAVAMVDATSATRWRKDLGTALAGVAVSVRGEVAVVAVPEQGVQLYHLDGGLVATIDLEESVVAAALSDDGTRILAETESGRMVLYNSRGEIQWEMDLDETPRCWHFGNGGDMLVVVTTAGEIKAYKTAEAEQEEGPVVPAAVSGSDDLDDFLAVEEVLFGAEEKPAQRAAAPPPSGTLLWKLKLRANALPAAQSLFRTAYDGGYLATVLTDGRLMVLSAAGKPAVKEPVGLPARLTPALPGKMIGAWTSKHLVMGLPAEGSVRRLEFPGQAVESLGCSEDFDIICTLDIAGKLSAFEASNRPTWVVNVGDVARTVHVSPDGELVVVEDEDGRFRLFDRQGSMIRKFRFGGGKPTLLGLGRGFSVFGRGGGKLTVLDSDASEVWTGVLFDDMTGVELLGRSLGVYSASGNCAVIEPWEGLVHEMAPPPGRVRLRCLPGHDPLAVHVAGNVITVFSGYRRKLDVKWRFECHAGVEMFDVDMDAAAVAALAEDKLYWIEAAVSG